jgi:hypothetical protein
MAYPCSLYSLRYVHLLPLQNAHFHILSVQVLLDTRLATLHPRRTLYIGSHLQIWGQCVDVGGAVGQRAAFHEAGDRSCQDPRGAKSTP